MAEARQLYYLGVVRVDGARDNPVLAAWEESDKEEGKIEATCSRVLNKIVQSEKKKVWARRCTTISRRTNELLRIRPQIWTLEAKREGYTIHVSVTPETADNLAFFIVSSNKYSFSPKTVLKLFSDRFAEAATGEAVGLAEPGSLTTAAKSVFDAILDKYAINKIEKVKAQAGRVKDAVRDNIGMVITRGNDLDDIEIKAAEMKSAASQFQGTSHALKLKFCCQNAKWTIILTLTIITIITVIVVAAVCSNSDCSSKD